MPVQLRIVDLDGPYSYADYGGDGDPLVLAHGIGGSHVNWISVAPGLAERHRVLAVDMLGFGLTPLDGRSADLPNQQRYLDRFIAEIAEGRATLIGHSMGGLIAMLQAARRPETVEGLVLVDPAACAVHGSPIGAPTWLMLALGAFPALGGRIAALQQRTRGTESLVTDSLERTYAPGMAIDPALLRAHVDLETRRGLMKTPYRGYVEAWMSMRDHHAESDGWVEDVLKLISAPTLLIYGCLDPLIRQFWFERLARLRPDWENRPLEGVGHDPQMETPELFLEAVLGWLTKPRPVATPR